MLQFTSLNREIIASYESSGEFPPRWSDMEELERVTNVWVCRLRADRQQRALTQGGEVRARELLDRLLRTEQTEYLDREDCTPLEKIGLVRELHRLNVATGAYHRFLSVLRPHIDRIQQREGRRAKLLELASGSGEFTLALARLAQDAQVPVDVTGSDVVPEYVDRGNAAAVERGLDVRFRVINAFNMEDLAEGSYDIAFIAQSMHHFTPGQLAIMVAQARRVAPRAFVGIDGHRSISLTSGLGLAGLLRWALPRGTVKMVHDAVTSGRKFFSEPELEMMAKIAAPRDQVRVRSLPTHFSAVEVTRPEDQM